MIINVWVGTTQWNASGLSWESPLLHIQKQRNCRRYRNMPVNKFLLYPLCTTYAERGAGLYVRAQPLAAHGHQTVGARNAGLEAYFLGGRGPCRKPKTSGQNMQNFVKLMPNSLVRLGEGSHLSGILGNSSTSKLTPRLIIN